jgi:hypothetical protein
MDRWPAVWQVCLGDAVIGTERCAGVGALPPHMHANAAPEER